MKSVYLTVGFCALCNHPISPSKSLGSICDEHPSGETVFTHENIELEVNRGLFFDPFTGQYEYVFDWSGTRIMINDRVATVDGGYSYAGSCLVQFDNEETLTLVSGIDDSVLRQFYIESGGHGEPPPLELPTYQPRAVELLPEPLAPISLHRDEATSLLSHLSIGSDTYNWQETSFPFYRTLHSFCNLYVRLRYGLGPESRGGFIGRGFRVENSYLAGQQLYGLVVYLGRSERAPAVLEAVRAIAIEASEMTAPEPGADIETVIDTWTTIMTTLLRYPWYDMPFQTIGDIWQNYCRMQDVLLNILPLNDIQQVLAFAKTQGRLPI